MNYLFLTFVFPFIGFVLLATLRDRLSEQAATIIGVGSMGLAALTALVSSIEFLGQPAFQDGTYLLQTVWQWMQIGSFSVDFGLRFDGLSLTMTGIITGVGFFIHLFASWYMRGEAGFARFFSYMNLFVASMLLLVLADNLVLLYLGWEGVGICSYLLIGFYYKNRDNSKAAIKAFTVTRVGDVFLAVGLYMLYLYFGTLNITDIINRAPDVLTVGSAVATMTALMLLGGAMGKSAQLGLHTWLADAMAGPTPVSALIHAATMVTAGVYLIARLHPVFLAAPNILHFVGVVGAFTLLVAGVSALMQSDIKRILAYSTMSQIGYMFLALGVGAWHAAIFHLMTHAFFKALLFLSAGAIIVSLHHEQNVFKMGGLRKSLPLVFWCFVIGGGALAAIPFVTVGFFSKDAILFEAFAAGQGWLFAAGVAGAFLTSFYTLRMIWLVFFGEQKTKPHAISGLSYQIPLVVLLVLSTAVGAWIHPPLAQILPLGAGELGIAQGLEHVSHSKHTAELIAVAAGLGGLALAAFFYFVNNAQILHKLKSSTLGQGVSHWMYHGLGFDALFDILFVKPFSAIARLLRKDPVDKLFNIVPLLSGVANRVVRAPQTGRVRGYAMSMALGAVVIIVYVMLGLLH